MATLFYRLGYAVYRYMNAKSNTLANQIYQHTLAICEGAASHLLLYYWSTQIKVLPPHALRTGNLWGQVGRKIFVSITSKCLWRTEFWLRNCSELSSELSSNNEILGETKANSLIPTFWGNSVFDEQYSTIQDWLLAITTGTRVLVVGTPMACNTCSRVLYCIVLYCIVLTQPLVWSRRTILSTMLKM